MALGPPILVAHNSVEEIIRFFVKSGGHLIYEMEKDTEDASIRYSYFSSTEKNISRTCEEHPDRAVLNLNPKEEDAFLHNLVRFAAGQLYLLSSRPDQRSSTGYPYQFVDSLLGRTSNAKTWLVVTVQDQVLADQLLEKIKKSSPETDHYFKLDDQMIFPWKGTILDKVVWEIKQNAGMAEDGKTLLFHQSTRGRLVVSKKSVLLRYSLETTKDPTPPEGSSPDQEIN